MVDALAVDRDAARDVVVGQAVQQHAADQQHQQRGDRQRRPQHRALVLPEFAAQQPFHGGGVHA
jgi:hypothetical protein